MNSEQTMNKQTSSPPYNVVDNTVQAMYTTRHLVVTQSPFLYYTYTHSSRPTHPPPSYLCTHTPTIPCTSTVPIHQSPISNCLIVPPKLPPDTPQHTYKVKYQLPNLTRSRNIVLQTVQYSTKHPLVLATIASLYKPTPTICSS